jgi:hypothetical protein
MSLYTNINTSVSAKLLRAKAAMDKYCFFKWNNVDAWEEYHAFIVTSKRGDLKFSTGPSFSNTYSSPQFGTNNNLLGVKYSTASVSFKVGFYYITNEDWRKILEAFHPLEIAWLEFGYDEEWRYQCKVNKIAEPSRYILDTINNEDYYYTETTITFDLVGEPVAYTKPYEFQTDTTTHTGTTLFKVKQNSDFTNSDLDFPLDISVNLNLSKILEGSKNSFAISCYTGYGAFSADTLNTQLFNIEFQNISYSNISADSEKHWPAFITLKYCSDTGLILQEKGSKYSLLTMQQSTAEGKRLVASISSQPYKWTGNYNKIVIADDSEENFTNAYIYFAIKIGDSDGIDQSNFTLYDKYNGDYPSNYYGAIKIEGNGMTNVI